MILSGFCRPIVLVTRPADDAGELCDAVRAAGFIPMLAPMLDIIPLHPTLPSFDDSQAIVFTSMNGVRHCPAVPRDRPVYCVGDRTADAARAAGFTTVVSASGDINDLEAVLAGANLKPDRAILHVCGVDVVRPLSVPGVRVEPLVVYRADMVTRLPWVVRVLIRLGFVTGVLFFSARTGQAFVNATKKVGLDRACDGIGALCLSDSVVESVSDLPWRELYTAQRPDRAAMLDLLDHLRP